MDLFPLGEMPAYLQVPEVDAVTAALVRTIATGRIIDAAGQSFDTAVPEEIHGWALELAALLYDNPRLRTTETVGPYSYTGAAAERQKEILDAVRTWRQNKLRGSGLPGTIRLTPALWQEDCGARRPGW